MNKLYMGIDVGTILTKVVIIDAYDNIITSAYVPTEGNPIKTVKGIIKDIRNEIDLDNYQVVSVGVTGSARKLIGLMLSADTVRNEVMASATGVIRLYPGVRTIFEIGGEDSKIILINNETVTDYAINTPCMAGTGKFIDSLFKRLNIRNSDIANINSNNKVNITSRCSVFAETELMAKLQAGYKKEDLIYGICHSVASNYINNVTKGKKINSPIIFIGGVSKNMLIVKEIENIINKKIIVDKNSHLMGAFGIAILARESKKEKVFDFNIDNYDIETKITNCTKCSNYCEMVMVYRNHELVDYWGNKCNKGNKIEKEIVNNI